MIEFPDNLPCPLLNGYGLESRDTTLRTTMASGFSRQRRAYEFVPPMVNASWIMKSDEIVIFEAWYRAVGSGSDWFRIELTTPTGKAWHIVRFASVYSGPKPAGTTKNWQVDMKLEFRDLLSFSGDDYLYDPLGIEYADVFDIVVNNWLPA